MEVINGVAGAEEAGVSPTDFVGWACSTFNGEDGSIKAPPWDAGDSSSGSWAVETGRLSTGSAVGIGVASKITESAGGVSESGGECKRATRCLGKEEASVGIPKSRCKPIQ